MAMQTSDSRGTLSPFAGDRQMPPGRNTMRDKGELFIELCIFQRNQSNRMCVYAHAYVIYYKELACVIMEAEEF